MSLSPSAPHRTLTVKLVLLGDAGVGKTALAIQFVKGTFSEFTESTIGASFLNQMVKLPDGTVVRFQIWDTAGQERFHSLAPMYYRGAQAAIVVYDITNSASFDRAQDWVAELHAQGDADVEVCFVGNKVDLEDDRQIDADSGSHFAQENGLAFMEASAKTGKNVAEMFLHLARKLVANNPLKAQADPRGNLRALTRDAEGNSAMAGDRNTGKSGCCS